MYAEKDYLLACYVRDVLKNEKVETVLYTDVIRPGNNIILAFNNLIKEGNTFIIIKSENLNDEFVNLYTAMLNNIQNIHIKVYNIQFFNENVKTLFLVGISSLDIDVIKSFASQLQKGDKDE